MKEDLMHPSSEELFAYRDGELTPEKRAILEAHVSGCSICRALIDQVSALEAELRTGADRRPAGVPGSLERERSRAGRGGFVGACGRGEGGRGSPWTPRWRHGVRGDSRRGTAGADEPPARARAREEAPSFPGAAVVERPAPRWRFWSWW